MKVIWVKRTNVRRKRDIGRHYIMYMYGLYHVSTYLVRHHYYLIRNITRDGARKSQKLNGATIQYTPFKGI
jgi:hypothetical protein